MLRVALFEMYNRYRLRLAPGSKVVKNTAATTKPVSVPVIRMPREDAEERRAALAERKSRAAASGAAIRRDRVESRLGSSLGDPRDQRIPPSRRRVRQQLRHQQGTGRALRRSEPRLRLHQRGDEPGRPCRPAGTHAAVAAGGDDRDLHRQSAGNAIAFKSWLEHTEPGARPGRTAGISSGAWATASGTPSSPSHATCSAGWSELGATPLGNFAFGDVGSPVWEDTHTRLERPHLADADRTLRAQPSEAAAARIAAEKAAEETLTATDSEHGHGAVAGRADRRADDHDQCRGDYRPSRFRPWSVASCRRRSPPRRTRHLEVSLPPGFAYTAGDHLGVCPQERRGDGRDSWRSAWAPRWTAYSRCRRA